MPSKNEFDFDSIPKFSSISNQIYDLIEQNKIKEAIDLFEKNEELLKERKHMVNILAFCINANNLEATRYFISKANKANWYLWKGSFINLLRETASEEIIKEFIDEGGVEGGFYVAFNSKNEKLLRFCIEKDPEFFAKNLEVAYLHGFSKIIVEFLDGGGHVDYDSITELLAAIVARTSSNKNEIIDRILKIIIDDEVDWPNFYIDSLLSLWEFCAPNAEQIGAMVDLIPNDKIKENRDIFIKVFNDGELNYFIGVEMVGNLLMKRVINEEIGSKEKNSKGQFKI